MRWKYGYYFKFGSIRKHYNQHKKIMVTTVVALFLSIHHFYNFHFCIQPQMIEEHLEVFLHLDAVVIHLSHSEDPHLTLPPNLEVDKTQI